MSQHKQGKNSRQQYLDAIYRQVNTNTQNITEIRVLTSGGSATINDSTPSGTSVFSSTKTNATYSTITNLVGHTGDATIHRSINDAGTAVTDLWSASKITTSLSGKANTSHTHVSADITDFESTLTGTTRSFTKQQVFGSATLSNTAGPVGWDLDVAQSAVLVTAQNHTIQNPTNGIDGAVYILAVNQSSTHTLTWDTNYTWSAGTIPVLTSGSGKTDIFTFIFIGGKMRGTYIQNFTT